MSLSNAIASLPKHEAILPASGMRVEYRPFIVKEEKILLMAAETRDEATINNAVRDVILACTGGKVDVNAVPLVDMEYLFLQLRSRSVGETTKPMVKCEKCEKGNEVTINLKEIQPTLNKDHQNLIQLVGNIKVQMRYPTLKSAASLPENDNDIVKTFLLLGKCIEKVFVGDTVYVADEIGEKEVYDFIDQLTQEQFTKLASFFETMPKIEKNVSFKCSCGHENNITMRGIASFF